MNNRFFLRFVLVFLAGFFVVGCFTAQAQNKLTKLDVQSKEATMQLALFFAQPYSEVAQIDFQLGVARITLPGVYTQLPTPYVVNDQLLKEVQVMNNGADTVLEIVFQNRFFDASELISIENKGGQLWVQLNQRAAPISESSVETPISGWNEDFLQSIVKTTVALVFVLAMILGLLKLYQALVAKKWVFYPKHYRPKICAVYHLSGKQKLWIIELFEQRFALGVTPQSVHLISKLDDEHTRFLQQWGNETGQMDIAKLRVRLQQQKQPAQPKLVKKSLLQINNAKAFKDELKKRIGSLKPVK